MLFANLDIENAMRRLADHRIEEAMREGKFDNLPGAGKPINLEPMPAEENARLRWWALKILKQNDVIPDEVLLRKELDRLQAALSEAKDEAAVEATVLRINDRVLRLNTLGTNALHVPFAPLDLDGELQRFRARTSGH